jgi:hypothetical protein
MMNHMSSFAAPAHWYESSNFNVPLLNNRTYSNMGPDRTSTIRWADGSSGVGITISGGAPYYRVNASHHPAWGKYPYYRTGDHWWLDEMQAHAVGVIGQSSFDLRNQTIHGSVYYGMCFDLGSGEGSRGMAWAQRMLDDAEWATPDNDPAKQYFSDMLTVTTYPALASYIAQANSNDALPYTDPNYATLGIFDSQDNSGHSFQHPWQHDFHTVVLGMAIARGRLTTSHAYITDHVVKWIYGRASDGCPYYGVGAYNMGIRQGSDQDWATAAATAWSQVNVNGAGVLDQSMGAFCPGSGIAAPYGSGDGFPYAAIQHSGAEIGRFLSILKASTVGDYLIANGESDVTNAQWASLPQWYIRPNG